MTRTLPFANEVDYWKTGSKTSAMGWIDKANKQLKDHGASSIVNAQGEQNGLMSFMVEFTLNEVRHRINWPVLPLPQSMKSETNIRSAQVQAATSLYHDVKACCTKSTRYGIKAGFLQFRCLPDGSTVQEMSDADLMHAVPAIMAKFNQPKIEFQDES